MSITWFITPYNPKHWEEPEDISEKPTSDLYVDAAALYQFIARVWPTFAYDADKDAFSTYIMSNPDGSTLRIQLYHNNQVISLNNDPAPFFFEFLLLYRAFVPSTYQLFFFNSSSWDSLELTLATTTEDIKQFMVYRD